MENKETKKSIKEFIKEQSFVVVITSILIVIIFSIMLTILFINNSDLKGNYEWLKKEKAELEEKINTYSKQIEDLSQSEKQQEINKEIKALENKVTSLTSEKTSLETTLNNLKQEVIKAKGEERTYPAGYLTAGKDFEVGRYKIYGGKSNFFVHSASGYSKVNIILGEGQYNVKEYVYTFEKGDQIQANSSFNMISIE